MTDLAFDVDTHTYTLDGRVVPSVTQVLADTVIDTTWFTEASRLRGSAVHAACHYDDEGDLQEGSLPSSRLGYLEAWRSFRKDTRVEILAVERRVLSRRYMYAGTLDRIVRFPGTNPHIAEIIDIKTGVPDRAAGLQMAAYGNALVEEGGLPWAISPTRRAVQLFDDGRYKVHVYDDLTDFATFTACLAVYRFKRGNAK